MIRCRPTPRTPSSGSSVRCSTPRDAPVNRVLKAVGIAATTPATGRAAGALLGRKVGRNTADALVAAEALKAGPGSVVVTSDPHDLIELLASETAVSVLRV